MTSHGRPCLAAGCAVLLGMAIKYRIVCENNSDARDFRVLADVAVTTRHNGGKVVICVIHAEDAAQVDGILDASHKVASYESEG